jgi:fluoroquinolone transport system permease protein
MLNQTAIRADFKLIIREPILILFMILPLFIIFITRLFIQLGAPLLIQYNGFDLSPYYSYVLAMSFLMAPFMLGTVCGFLMIDDRDARMYELMSVTPLGYLGYLVMRSLIPFCAAFIYTFIGYLIINIHYINPLLLVLIALLNGTTGIILGLLLFNFAGDKVKAVASSKGLSLLNVFAVADLFQLSWLSLLAAMTPLYWIVRIITVSAGLLNITIAILVHLIWLVVMLNMIYRRSNINTA